MAKKKSDKLKIMVSSTVYYFKPELEQPCATLTGYGYEVLNSHLTSPHPLAPVLRAGQKRRLDWCGTYVKQ